MELLTSLSGAQQRRGLCVVGRDWPIVRAIEVGLVIAKRISLVQALPGLSIDEGGMSKLLGPSVLLSRPGSCALTLAREGRRGPPLLAAVMPTANGEPHENAH